MRYGIFSDTHANLAALEAVLRCLDNERIDALVCIGDTVGYGPLPQACCDKIRTLTKHTILGNHDAAVAGRMDYSYYYDAARQALDLHASLISRENLTWLRGLPFIVREGDTHFCHGSPLEMEEFEYIFTVGQASTCLPIWDDLGRVTFIGHSHLCKAYALSEERVFEVVTKSFELREGFRYIVSVGSVGQPRDYDPRASYTIYDSNRGTFEFRRVAYDIDATAQRIFETKGLADSFGTRLYAGV